LENDFLFLSIYLSENLKNLSVILICSIQEKIYSTFNSFFRNCLSHTRQCRTRKCTKIAMDDSQTGALEVRADGTE